MQKAGLKQNEISIQLGLTLRHVGYAIAANNISPRKAKGRQPILSPQQVDEIETFVCLSFDNRRMTWVELATGLFQSFGVSEFVVRSEMKKRGYSRCIARGKLPLSDRNKLIRKQWAEDHIDWTEEDWEKIL